MTGAMPDARRKAWGAAKRWRRRQNNVTHGERAKMHHGRRVHRRAKRAADSRTPRAVETRRCQGISPASDRRELRAHCDRDDRREKPAAISRPAQVGGDGADGEGLRDETLTARVGAATTERNGRPVVASLPSAPDYRDGRDRSRTDDQSRSLCHRHPPIVACATAPATLPAQIASATLPAQIASATLRTPLAPATLPAQTAPATLPARFARDAILRSPRGQHEKSVLTLSLAFASQRRQRRGAGSDVELRDGDDDVPRREGDDGLASPPVQLNGATSALCCDDDGADGRAAATERIGRELAPRRQRCAAGSDVELRDGDDDVPHREGDDGRVSPDWRS